QQAAQLPPAHRLAPGDPWPGRGGRARQRALRGRRGRDHPSQAAPAVRPAHDAAPAHRDLLRGWCEGERALLREKAGAAEATRVETERFKAFTLEELLARDKVNLDITWMRDPGLDDADSLAPPEVIAAEIVEDLQAALAEFAAIAESLGGVKEQELSTD